MTWYEKVRKVCHDNGFLELDPYDVLALCYDILHEYADYLEETEPQAINTIRELRESAESLPLEDDKKCVMKKRK